MRHLAIVLAALVLGAPAQGQDQYPSKNLRIIVPTSPGGVTDILGRAIGNSMQQTWGRTVVVENRVGGNEMIGTGAVAKSAPDGYTLLVTGSGPITGAPFMIKQMPYDPLKDLTALVMLAEITPMLHVPASSPIKTVKDFIELAKAKPDTLNYASMGNGTYPHVAMEEFKRRTGIKLAHIPYKGSSPAMNALVTGEASVLIVNLSNVAAQVKQGNIRTIASAGPQRAPMRPDLPTIAEAADLPGFATGSWWGIFGPANLPAAVVDKIRSDAAKMLDTPELRQLYEINTLTRRAMSGPEFEQFIRGDMENQRRQFASAGIVPE